MEIIIFILLVIIFCQSTIPKHRAAEVKEKEQLLKEASELIVFQQLQIEEKDKQIEKDRGFLQESADLISEMHDGLLEYDKRETVMREQISRLRRELQKRTDQYNDLVDLAREKGIIGE